MTNLKTILMSSVAAISLAAAPALAQQATTETETQTEVQQTAQAPAGRSYDQQYGESFAEWGDRSVQELVGTSVVNDAGETIGEIDNFGLAQDQIVAIVGIGGFLGVGEHSVAVPLDQLTFDGDQLVLAGVTREELEAMPQYNEGDAQAFAADQTLSSGYESAEAPTADQPMAGTSDDVATADDAGTGMAAGEEMAEGDATREPVGEDVAQTAGEGGEAVQQTGQQTAGEVAETTAQTGTEAEQATESAEAEMTQDAESEQTDMATTEGSATTAEQTDMAATEGSAPTAEQTDMAATDGAATGEAGATGGEAEMAATGEETGWTDEMEGIFADIADQQIADLIGMDVASSDGEVVGQVDNFALQGEDVVAIVGVGGFLGIGERNVALSLDEMTYDGERLVLSSITEDQLSDMPEVGDDSGNYLPEEGTLRESYNQ